MFNTKDKKKKIVIRPYIYSSISIHEKIILLLVLLSLHFVALIITKSLYSIVIVIFTVLAATLANLLNNKLLLIKRTQSFQYLPSIYQGLVIGLLTPSSYSPLVAFLITFIVMLVIKHFFGGFYRSIVCIPCFTVILLWIINPAAFGSFLLTRQEVSGLNPLVTLLDNGSFPIYYFDNGVTTFLNENFFSLFNVTLPAGFISFLLDNGAAIPAFRFSFLTIIGGAVLFAFDLTRLFTTSIYLLTYLFLVKVASPIFFGGAAFSGDVLLALFTSGLLFILTYLLNVEGGLPIHLKNRVLYSVIGGVLCFLIVGCGTSPIGMSMSVLMLNIMGIVLTYFENKDYYKSVAKLFSKDLAAR